MKEPRWNQRAFVVTGALLSGLALPVSGLADHAAGGPGGSSAAGWSIVHTSLGVLFVSFCVWHAALNRRALLRYLRGRTRPALCRRGKCSSRWRSSAESWPSRSRMRCWTPERHGSSPSDLDALHRSGPVPLPGVLVLRDGLPRGRARQVGVPLAQARRRRPRRALHRMWQLREGLQVRSAQRPERLRVSSASAIRGRRADRGRPARRRPRGPSTARRPSTDGCGVPPGPGTTPPARGSAP